MDFKLCSLVIIILELLIITESASLHNQTKRTANRIVLSKKLPQAIIIGAKKCGTRALLKFIGAHQNVSAANAETHFFDRFYHMGYEWYREQMPLSNDAQITIEKTPKYLVDKLVPKRVYKMNPDIKLIVVLRNPVVRAVSEYVQSQANKLKPGLVKRNIDSFKQNDSVKFQKMLYNVHNTNNYTKSRRKRSIRTDWPIVKNGIYYEHIKQWLRYFKLDQFLFVNGEKLIRDPSSELDKVQVFLNLNRLIKREHFVHNKRKGFACIRKPLDSNQVKCLNDQKGRKHPRIDTNVLNDIADFYRPYNQMLFRLINQKPWWPI